MSDLLDQLELPQCECLNASNEHTLRHCLDGENREERDKFLQSDCDEELCITLKFMQPVKIRSIIVQGVDDDVESAPNHVRLFKNKNGIDFESAKSDKPDQELPLTKEHVKSGAKVDLRFVLFQGVQQLTLFFPSNHSDGASDETKIARLAVIGELVEQQGLKRTVEQQEATSKGDWLK